MAEFMNLLSADGGAEYERDYWEHRECQYLKEQIDLRNGSLGTSARIQIPAQFVAREAASRLFKLMEFTQYSLRHVFTEKEMVIILNTTCDTVWEWRPGRSSLAGMVADDNGIEHPNLLPKDSLLYGLLVKLSNLTPAQNLALVDVCEGVWRALSGGPLGEMCDKLGMPLAE
jgi:hypothetical protein